MRKLKAFWAAGMAGVMTLGFSMTAYADFHWDIADDSQYVGTATISVSDNEFTYQQPAIIVKDGTTVTFTELDNNYVDFGELLYSYDGLVNHASAGMGISDLMSPGQSFSYTIKSNVSADWAPNAPEAGVYCIYTMENDEEMKYSQYFVIDGKFDPARMSDVQRADVSAGSEDTSNVPADSQCVWKSDGAGWWVERADGSYLVNEWYYSPDSGLWYYMGADGYMLTNTTTPDGCYVNGDGVWVQ